MSVRGRSTFSGVFCLVTLLFAGLVGCGENSSQKANGGKGDAKSDWEGTVAAAQKEQTVVIYVSKSDELMQRVIDGFKQKYPGINAQFVRLTSAQMANRVDQERGAGKLGADIVWNTEVRWQDNHAAAGNLLKPKGPAASAWADSDYASGRVRLSTDPVGIAYNTKKTTKPPTDWGDLLDPQYKGVITSIDTVSTPIFAFYDFLSTKLGEEFLVNLGKQGVTLQPSSSPIAQSIASGENSITPFAYSWLTVPLAAKGAPIEIVYPSSGTVTFDQSAVVFKDAPHPNAAVLFMDFMMSKEGQLIINGNKQGFSVVKGIDTGLTIGAGQLTVPDWKRYEDAGLRTQIQTKVRALLHR